MSPAETSKRSRLFPAIMVSAFFLRMVGIRYGLPHLYHQDEPMMVNHALAIGAGGWNTHYFVIPPFVSYGLFFLYGVYFIFGYLTGIFHGTSDLVASFVQDPTAFYVLGRFLMGVLFGTATVGLLFKIGQRLFSERTALTAALLLALLPLHVQHSHYIYADIPLTFAVTLLFYRLILLTDDPSFKNYALAGVVFGWAVSVKYTAFYFLPAIFAAHACVPGAWRQADAWKKALWSALAALGVFAMMAPFTFLDWASFWETMRRQSAAEVPTGWAHHFFYSLIGGGNGLVTAFAVIGIPAIFTRRPRAAWILIAGAVSYYIVSSFFSQHFARYILPLTPILALLAAGGWERVSHFLRDPIRKTLTFAIALTLLVPTVAMDRLFLQEDTRTLCLQWFERAVPSGSVVVCGNRFFSPHLLQTKEQLLSKRSLLGNDPQDAVKKRKLDIEQQTLEGRKTYNVYTLKTSKAFDPQFMGMRPFVEADWNEIRKIGAQYLVLDQGYPSEAVKRFKEMNGNAMEKVASFSPYVDPEKRISVDPYDSTAASHMSEEIFSRVRLGPYLEVYKIKKP